MIYDLKIGSRINRLNSCVFDMAIDVLDEYPQKFASSEDLLNYMKNDVRSKYQEFMNYKDAMTFDFWWNTFFPFFKELIVVPNLASAMESKKVVMYFDEFVNEGVLSAVKTQWKLTSVNAFVMDKAAKLVAKEPNRFQDGTQVLNALRDDIKKEYNKKIKGDDALTFEDWWKEFSPSLANIIVVEK